MKASRSLCLAVAIAAMGVVAGCATSQPFSEIDGYRWNKVELNTFDVTIISVDGSHYVQRGTAPIVITPGQHKIVVEAHPVGGFRFGEQRTLDLNVEPCTRYWLEARKENGLKQDFTPAVNYSAPITPCSAG